MLWILGGVVFAGAVQDFIVLFISTRRDGRSLGDLVKMELGTVPGVIALFGAFLIMVIILAVLALIVVKALTNSPWGTFTVAATIPIALFMGIYTRYIRPGRIGEVSIIGFVLLMASIAFGQAVHDSPTLAAWFTFSGTQLTWILIGYGFIASVLPVWLLLAPRDYLSTFLKIGTILGLAIGILVVAPELKMPALTKFVDGTGPVWSGNLFPFLFITIACGAVSGFHALISSGTTPKLIDNETNARFIGYGAMLMESFVAIMALVAACVIEPGVYFAMNAPAAVLGSTPEAVANTVTQWGFVLTPDMLTQTAKAVGETTIIARAGGAPTLAVGMAHILHQVIGGEAMMAFWYHFAILFEALFILTAVDAGTRAGRFMLQDLLGTFHPALKRTESLPANLVATALCVAAWGYFLYQGVVDPLGGINTLWPLFGISNQMLAAIALVLGTVVLFKMKRERYAWVTIVPTAWLLICTLTAGWQKIFDANPKVSFLAHAAKLQASVDQGKVLAPAKSLAQMKRIIFNDYVDAALAGLFIFVVVAIAVYGLLAVLRAPRGEAERARDAVRADAGRAGARQRTLTGGRDVHRSRQRPAQRGPLPRAGVAADGRAARLRHLRRAHARHPSGPRADDLRGILPRASERAIRVRGREVLLNRAGAAGGSGPSTDPKAPRSDSRRFFLCGRRARTASFDRVRRRARPAGIIGLRLFR
jgi:carbon starvation protein